MQIQTFKMLFRIFHVCERNLNTIQTHLED